MSLGAVLRIFLTFLLNVEIPTLVLQRISLLRCKHGRRPYQLASGASIARLTRFKDRGLIDKLE